MSDPGPDSTGVQPELPLPFPELSGDLPLLPVRMVNEYEYCPRLAYLEWVQGEWADSGDTVEGRFVHRRVDRPGVSTARSTVTATPRVNFLRSACPFLFEARGGIKYGAPPISYSPRKRGASLERWRAPSSPPAPASIPLPPLFQRLQLGRVAALVGVGPGLASGAFQVRARA